MRINYARIRRFLNGDQAEKIACVSGVIEVDTISAAGGGRPWDQLSVVTRRRILRLMQKFTASHAEYKFVPGDQYNGPCIMTVI